MKCAILLVIPIVGKIQFFGWCSPLKESFVIHHLNINILLCSLR